MKVDDNANEAVVQMLNAGLATEIACVLRYKRHHYKYMMMATGTDAQNLAADCLKHAAEEQAHANMLAERIVQLGGEPDLNPAQFSEQDCEPYDEGTIPGEMIREDLVAERRAIDKYAEMIRNLGDDDPFTRGMLEQILVAERSHAEGLVKLLSRECAGT